MTTPTEVRKSTDQARQGVTGHNVRHVLWLSTMLIAVMFAAVFLYMRG